MSSNLDLVQPRVRCSVRQRCSTRSRGTRNASWRPLAGTIHDFRCENVGGGSTARLHKPFDGLREPSRYARYGTFATMNSERCATCPRVHVRNAGFRPPLVSSHARGPCRFGRALVTLVVASAGRWSACVTGAVDGDRRARNGRCGRLSWSGRARVRTRLVLSAIYKRSL